MLQYLYARPATGVRRGLPARLRREPVQAPERGQSPGRRYVAVAE